MIKCPISIKCYKVKQNNLEMVKKKKKNLACKLPAIPLVLWWIFVVN